MMILQTYRPIIRIQNNIRLQPKVAKTEVYH